MNIGGYIGEKGRVDEYAVASLKFPGGIIAEISAGVAVDQENVVRIFGEEGSITVLNPWNPLMQRWPNQNLN